MACMSPKQIMEYKPYTMLTEADENGALSRAKKRMQDAGTWTEHQTMGRRYPIGCVALEITQRCNLDCTLCYLSEHSESVKDIPMTEIFRRIDQIKFHYGKNTDVQITGGDPTLRKESELLDIVRYIRKIGLRPTLMTNGIKATRKLLLKLVDVGLNDVAFHVDLTQERKGFQTEMELNAIRERYIERVRGLPIAVVFNTTVHKNNFAEIPDLIRFFKKHADVVGMVSFQLQADTGRGLLRKRVQIINQKTVIKKIEEGVEAKISFDTVQIGHTDCHNYGTSLIAHGKSFDLFDNKKLTREMLSKMASFQFDRRYPHKVVWQMTKFFLRNNHLFFPVFFDLVWRFLRMSKSFVLGKAKVYKQSYFIQNFMSADELEKDRIDACSFMVMTSRGPISMCLHNAKRDEYILDSFKVKTETGEKIWQPLTGELKVAENSPLLKEANQ